MTYPGASGPGVIDALQHGDPHGSVWRPAEVDVSIRPGWFYHPVEDSRVRSAENLLDLYFTSVGRNGKLLLNVPPTRDGLLHDADIRALSAFNDRRRAIFADDLAANARPRWRTISATTAVHEIDLGHDIEINVARLAEDITPGQRVARYTLEGAADAGWKPIARGTTIGYTKLERFESVRVRRLRLTIEAAVDTPEPVSVELYRAS
ncbi:MAG TPA: alpha-L-fucosidase [Gemmatimonadaceae bacterium]|nr:alpha-L-fucosidase [Gemmatimonadaceae bacterium]